MKRKVKEKKEAEAQDKMHNVSKKKAKTTKVASQQAEDELQNEQTDFVTAQFVENDNYFDMEVTFDQRKEFPSPSDDDEETISEDEEIMEQMTEFNENLNATRLTVAASALGSRSPRTQIPQQRPSEGQQNIPNTSEDQPSGTFNNVNDGTNLLGSLNIMQSFMLKKGIIEQPFGVNEIQDLMSEAASHGAPVPMQPRISVVPERVQLCKTKTKTVQGKKPNNKIKHNEVTLDTNASEVTIYKKAV